jgi:endoglucanase
MKALLSFRAPCAALAHLVARPRPTSLLVLWPTLSLVACGQGTGKLHPNGSGGPAAGEAGAAGAEGGIAPPSEVRLTSNAQGHYGPDELGFQGRWTTEAGPGSQIELSFEDGNVCLRGETAAVPDEEDLTDWEEYRTYWGAEATFSLCEKEEGNLQPVAECLGAAALGDFVGIAFTLEGSDLPWLVSVRFPETGREDPTSVWLESEGETVVLFERATSPFDSSAPPITPSQLESVTVRAVGSRDGVQSFDFCLTDFRALFGEQWGEAMIPDWLNEPGPGKQVDYVGANLVGAEFGEDNLPGTYGTDYIYPDASDVDLYAGKGMNIFRVPFRWERMQRQLYAELDETELGYLKATIAAARERNATVIIDPHNFARYDDGTEKIIGVDIEYEAFADFWAKLARECAGDELVWFGLMNEPHHMETETWLDAANAAILAIRQQGANNLVLVPGSEWTGAHAWFDDYYGTPNSEVMPYVVDPEDNFAFELHQYFDAGYSGTSNTCVSETIGVDEVEPVTEWLREQGFRGFFGEFGGSDDPVCLGAMDNLLSHLGENADVWLGWTVWAASQWGIQHNIRPLSSGEDVLQMLVLLRHMDPP